MVLWYRGRGSGARLIPPTRPSPPGLAWPGHSPFTFVVALGFISPFFHEKKATPQKVPIQNTVYVICTQFKKSLPKLVAKVITGENSQKKKLSSPACWAPVSSTGLAVVEEVHGTWYMWCTTAQTASLNRCYFFAAHLCQLLLMLFQACNVLVFSNLASGWLGSWGLKILRRHRSNLSSQLSVCDCGLARLDSF